MARIARVVAAGLPHHVTQQGSKGVGPSQLVDIQVKHFKKSPQIRPMARFSRQKSGPCRINDRFGEICVGGWQGRKNLMASILALKIAP